MIPKDGTETPAALSAVDSRTVRSLSSSLSEFDAVAGDRHGYYSDYLDKSSAEIYRSIKDISYPPLPERIGSPQDFFRFQHETSRTVRGIIDIAIDSYLENMSHARGMPAVSPRRSQLFRIHENSRDKVGVRGVHSRIYNLALGGGDDSIVARIGASMELLMDHEYCANQILDGKGGADPRANIFGAKSNLELSKLLFKMSDRVPEGSREVYDSMLSDHREILDRSYDGAHIDTNFLNWENLKDSSFEERLKMYNKRSYLMNALFFEKMADIAAKSVYMRSGGEVANSDLESVRRYAFNFGMGTQLVNDVADFVPPEQNAGTRTKLPTDSYSDLRHRMMTLPVIYSLEMADKPDRERLVGYLEKEGRLEDEELLDATKIFKRFGARDCRALARVYKERASKVAKSFPEPVHSMMSYSVVMLDSNRYWRALA